MRKLIFIFNIILITLFFSGCQIDSFFKPSKAEMQLKEKELNAKIVKDKQQLDIQKEIELAKISSNLEKEKILTQNKEKENLYKLKLQENQTQLQFQKYLVLLAALVVVIIAIAFYIYFNNKRKDKLKAYEDNMEKYFKSKENQAKIQIANKIIDTIATGSLSENQENLLISNIDGKSNINTKALQSINQEEIVDAQIIEDKKSKKKKKKSKIKVTERKKKKSKENQKAEEN